MRISNVRIQNFRSLKSVEFSPTAFNVFVGQNNHGKTNLFEAINWFYFQEGDVKDIQHAHDATNQVEVEITFSEMQTGLKQIKNAKNKASLEKLLATRDTIKVVRRSPEPSKRFLFDEAIKEWTDKNFAGFDKAFNDCIPRLEYIQATKQLDEVSKFGKKTPIGMMLSGVLTAILEKSTKYAEFKDKFEELFQSEESEVRAHLDKLSGDVKLNLQYQFPDCTKVSFEISEPAFDDLLKNFVTKVDDGIETTANEKGDGMQRALMLAIIKTYADYRRKNDELGKSFIFVIDEGELHLHPTAQRQLKDALLQVAGQKDGDQVMISTHSSVLVTDDHLPQTIYKVEKTKGITSISKVTKREKPDVIYELLGGSPADLLLPNNFLIVEGLSEYILLTKIIERFYPEQKSIHIIRAQGDARRENDAIYAINTVFTPLYTSGIYKEKLIILADKPRQEASMTELKRNYPFLERNGQLFILPVPSLEEYYPAPWTKTGAEVSRLGPGEKTTLAKTVAAGISKEDFERNMPIVHKSLLATWQKAFT